MQVASQQIREACTAYGAAHALLRSPVPKRLWKTRPVHGISPAQAAGSAYDPNSANGIGGAVARGTGKELPDAATVGSGADLAHAARTLMTALGLNGAQIAGAAGLSPGTVSDLVNGKAFPRQETFSCFITRGCARPWEPWRQAWARAHKETLRRRPVEDLAEDIERLEGRVEELETALAATKDAWVSLSSRWPGC